MNNPLQGGTEPCGVDAARLRALNLTVRYRDKTVLDITDLSISSGVTALTGPNGAGKSTLLKIFALLAPATSGDLLLGGLKTDSKKAVAQYRKSVGYLPQNAEFPGHFTVEEAVTYSAWLRGVPSRRRPAAVRHVISEMGLSSAAAAKLRDLSGGNQQRAHIAQAIVHDPDVLLLDEPTTGIDVEYRVELRRILNTIGQRCCVVLSTHHTEDIEFLADRVVSLRKGRVVFDGTPEELIAHADGDASRTLPEGSGGSRSIERVLRDLGEDR